MKALSAAVITALASGTIRYFSLIEIGFSTPLYLTDYPSDITYDGTVYISEGALREYEPPKLSPTIDKETYKMSFIDHANELQTEFRNGAVGTDCIILLGFIDSGTGLPDTTPANIIHAYSGDIDGTGIDISNYEEKIAYLNLGSPMAKLDSSSPLWTTRFGMDQWSDADTSFDRVNDDNGKIKLKWGKA